MQNGLDGGERCVRVERHLQARGAHAAARDLADRHGAAARIVKYVRRNNADLPVEGALIADREAVFREAARGVGDREDAIAEVGGIGIGDPDRWIELKRRAVLGVGDSGDAPGEDGGIVDGSDRDGDLNVEAGTAVSVGRDEAQGSGIGRRVVRSILEGDGAEDGLNRLRSRVREGIERDDERRSGVPAHEGADHHAAISHVGAGHADEPAAGSLILNRNDVAGRGTGRKGNRQRAGVEIVGVRIRDGGRGIDEASGVAFGQVQGPAG